MGHALMSHYFVVQPSVKIQEVLAGYVEYQLRKSKELPLNQYHINWHSFQGLVIFIRHGHRWAPKTLTLPNPWSSFTKPL